MRKSRVSLLRELYEVQGGGRIMGQASTSVVECFSDAHAWFRGNQIELLKMVWEED